MDVAHNDLGSHSIWISSSKDIDLNWKIDKKDIKKIFLKPSKENIEYIISLIK